MGVAKGYRMRNEKKFRDINNRLLKKLGRGTHAVVERTIDSLIAGVNRSLHTAVNTVYDGEKVKSIGEVIESFGGGLCTLRDHDSMTPYFFNELVQSYARLFNAGVDDRFKDFCFSRGLTGQYGLVRLDLYTTDDRLDWSIRLYECALSKGIAVAPQDVRVSFGEHIPGPFPAKKIFRKVEMYLDNEKDEEI